MTVMQKLLTPAMAAAVSERGSVTLGGPVTRAVDVVDMSPEDLVAAHGWSGPGMPWDTAQTYVDVLRFESNALMDLVVPGPVGPRPWPTYDTGFLHRGTVPVWQLARTRMPVDAEYWRIGADGQQRSLSVYAGAAVGWARGRTYRPPVGFTGPRATWRGGELSCLLTRDGRGVELVSVSDQAPEGFETTRPGVHRRLVPLAECDAVFELDLTATWRGTRVRVLQVAGEQAQVQLLDPDAESVARLEAVALEPGGFEAVAPRAELTDTAGTTRELPLSRPDVDERAAALLEGLEKLPPYVGMTMRGQTADARFLEPGATTTLTAPLSTTRLASLAHGEGVRGVFAIWSSTGRSVAAFSAYRDEEEVVLLPGSRFTLVETRLIEGVDVHLVLETEPGQESSTADLDALVVAARTALEIDEAPPTDRAARYVGDLG